MIEEAGMAMTPARARALKDAISKLMAGMMDQNVPASILSDPRLEKMLFLTKRYPKLGENPEFQRGLLNMVLGGRQLEAAGGPSWKNPFAIKPQEFSNPALGINAQQLLKQQKEKLLPSENSIEQFLLGGALGQRKMTEDKIKKATKTAEDAYKKFQEALIEK